MTWMTLGEALNGATAKGFDVDGDGGAATPSVSRKNAESTRLPASVTGQRQREEEALGGAANPGQEEFRAPLTVSRHRRVTSPNGLPRPVARLCLIIDNEGGGGRLEEGGPCVRRLRRNSWSDRARELGWVVHSAASR